MTRSYAPLLLLLAAIWGASYLFIKVAVDEIEPTAMMFFRLLPAGLALFAFIALQSSVRTAAADVRAAAGGGLVLGAINNALPFTLIAWGEKHVDSGVAAIANATVPIFVVLLAIRFQPSERVYGARLVGIVLGLVGVGVLAGLQPSGGIWAVAGTLAVVLSSLLYAASGLYGQRRLTVSAGPVLATASTLAGALYLLPFALLQLPESMPSFGAIAAVAALSLLGTSFAQLIMFRILRLHGAARLSLVTYVMPPVALFYGALFLDEAITVAAVAGLGLILLGVALGSGAVGLARRQAAPAAPRA